jgi:hypothetical protein
MRRWIVRRPIAIGATAFGMAAVFALGSLLAAPPQPTSGSSANVTAATKTAPRAAAINRHGGHAEVVKLPDIGIRGNTHFIMSDLNNVQVADLLSEFLKKHGLDRR